LPSLGGVQVICRNAERFLATLKGGIEYLELKFVTAGKQQFPAGELNTITGVASAVANALTTFGIHFQSVYSTTELPNFVGDSSLYNLIEIRRPWAAAYSAAQSLVSVLSHDSIKRSGSSKMTDNYSALSDS